MQPITRSGRTLGLIAVAVVLLLTSAHLAPAQQQGAFERTLKVTGPVNLVIRTGSGHIRIRPGGDGTVAISGRIRAGRSWFSGDATARIREIEKDPPIDVAGNTVTVGRRSEDANLFRNISISYEVTVPAQTSVVARTGSGGVDVGDLRGSVEAHSGSGGIVVGRIAGPVVASTGSGGIEVAGAQSLDTHSGSGSLRADAIAAAATAKSGSGSIRIAHVGKGDLDVSSSSGDVVVTGVDGAARISASSGGITVEGRPSGPWTIHASSGRVTLRVPPDAPFDIDARVGSGGIDSAHPVTMTGRLDRHRVQGKVRGGGALVDVSTGSGHIRIQ